VVDIAQTLVIRQLEECYPSDGARPWRARLQFPLVFRIINVPERPQALCSGLLGAGTSFPAPARLAQLQVTALLGRGLISMGSQQLVVFVQELLHGQLDQEQRVVTCS
jgi:hypothetical protein